MAQKIIWKKFHQWKKNSDPLKARVTIFEQIRDIPYYLVEQVDDPYEWAALILEKKQGSCAPKHYLLGLLFSMLGLQVKYTTYHFRWSEQKLQYPEALKKIVHDLPVGYHAACKTFLAERWVLLDATWDSALSKASFPVNLNWNGLSDTINAVMPFEEVTHDTLQERLNYIREKKSLYTLTEKNAYLQFMGKFNLWLEKLRS